MCICCVTNCCCRKSPMKTINLSLLVLISCCLFFSLLTSLIRSGKTSRYKEDLIYLNLYNNDDISTLRYLPNIIKEENLNLRNLRNYTYYNGKEIATPEEEIEYQSLFKNWKKTEITLNLIRFFLFFFHFFIALYFLITRNKSLDLNENIFGKILSLSMASITLCIIQIVYTTILMYLRSMTVTTDDQIGFFYDINETTNFARCSAWNIIFDIIIVVLISICICFSYRIYYNVKFYKGKNIVEINKNGVIQIVQVNPNIQPGIIMVDQNGQYLYAQPIGNNQIPNIIYQGGYNIQGNINNGNNQNFIGNNNNIGNNQPVIGNNNIIDEKYNA